MPSGARTQYITKLDAARRQLVAAVRLFFDDREPVSIHTLAHASLELISGLCRRDNIASILDRLPEHEKKIAIQSTNFHRNFFKHSDRDPDSAAEAFSDEYNDTLLFMAGQQLDWYFDGKLPVEVNTFLIWHVATLVGTPLWEAAKGDPWVEFSMLYFPKLHEKSRIEQKACGKEVMLKHLSDPYIVDHHKTDRSQRKFWE